MKKFASIILAIIILVSLFSFITSATGISDATITNNVISETVEYYPDGSSVVITVAESVNKNSVRANTYSKSGTKTYTALNSSGDVLWKFIVKGTFSVNSGVSATCTSASYSTASLASGWSLKSGSSYASGNKAIGDGTFQHKILFIVTDTKSCHIVLNCDANGNLS